MYRHNPLLKEWFHTNTHFDKGARGNFKTTLYTILGTNPRLKGYKDFDKIINVEIGDIFRPSILSTCHVSAVTVN